MVFHSIFYWQSRYGGYSGDLTPTAALELLKTEGRILLVDIRPEASKLTQMLYDLHISGNLNHVAYQSHTAERSGK